MSKTFVKVTAEHDEKGNIRPLVLTWTDGRQYEIDRVTDIRQAPSLKGEDWELDTLAESGGKKYIYFATREDGSSKHEAHAE